VRYQIFYITCVFTYNPGTEWARYMLSPRPSVNSVCPSRE